MTGEGGDEPASEPVGGQSSLSVNGNGLSLVIDTSMVVLLLSAIEIASIVFSLIPSQRVTEVSIGWTNEVGAPSPAPNAFG